MFDTYYTVLGISETATQKEIKAAYRELIKQVHPDSVPNASPYWKQAAEEKSKEVTEAYRVLSNTIQRAKYDQNLADLRKSAQAAPQPQPQPVSQPQPPSTPQSHTRSPRRSLVYTGVVLFGLFCVGGFVFGLLGELTKTAQPATTQPVQPSAAQPTTAQPASGFDPSKPFTVVVPKTIAKPVAKVEKAPEPMTVAWAKAHANSSNSLVAKLKTKEEFCAADLEDRDNEEMTSEQGEGYCLSPLLFEGDYLKSLQHIVTITWDTQLSHRCAFNSGSLPCHNAFPSDPNNWAHGVIAELKQGDKLVLLEPICKRTTSGLDACHVKTVIGGWVGYVDADCVPMWRLSND